MPWSQSDRSGVAAVARPTEESSEAVRVGWVCSWATVCGVDLWCLGRSVQASPSVKWALYPEWIRRCLALSMIGF